jgi:hypothetical protein
MTINMPARHHPKTPPEDASEDAPEDAPVNTNATFDDHQHADRAPPEEAPEDVTATAGDDTHIVGDGNEDVAMNADQERLMVQAPGRHHYRRVFLWNGSKEDGKTNDRSQGMTNKSYNPDEESPKRHPVARLPTGQELEPGEQAIEYIEVGIVVGENPSKYKKPFGVTNPDCGKAVDVDSWK